MIRLICYFSQIDYYSLKLTMADSFHKVKEYWKSTYSEKISKSRKYKTPEYFKRMAGLMAPGNSYYYIANFHTLELEFISDSVKDFTGEEPSQVNLEKLLALVLPEEIDAVHKKEQIIQSFFLNFLKPEEQLDYKICYTYKCKTYEGTKRLMLHQASVLSMGEEGRFVHVFSIHSDISHLYLKNSNDVSFININGGPSYYNVKSSVGDLDGKHLKQTKNLSNLFTKRELDIVKELAIGKNVKQIAESLHISKHTVHTHKKNMLRKVDCQNSTHLVSICLAEGLISI